MYSITSKASFHQADLYKAAIERQMPRGTQAPIYLVGNKCDLGQQNGREVTRTEGEWKAEQWQVQALQDEKRKLGHVMFSETSALAPRTTEGANKGFGCMIKELASTFVRAHKMEQRAMAGSDLVDVCKLKLDSSADRVGDCADTCVEKTEELADFISNSLL